MLLDCRWWPYVSKSRMRIVSIFGRPSLRCEFRCFPLIVSLEVISTYEFISCVIINKYYS